MSRQLRTATFKIVDILMILTMVLGSPMNVAAAPQAQGATPALTVAQSDYAPGDSAHVTGTGFAPGAYILAVNSSDVQWDVTADSNGNFESDSPALGSEGNNEVRAYASDWNGDWGTPSLASASFTVTAPPPPTDPPTEAPTATDTPTDVPTDTPTATQEPTNTPTDEPTATTAPTDTPTDVPTDTPTLQPVPLLTPFIQSDKADYNPGELVTLRGGNWQGDTQVRIFVNDNLGQIWSRDVIVDVASDGTIVDSFNLPTLFVSSYIVSASGQQTGRVVTTTFTDAAALTLTKSASPLTYTASGQAISFSYVLKNTGTTTLNGPFTVTDNKVPSVSCPVTPTLAVNASITCTGTYTITAADMALGYAVNTATAFSSNPGATTSNTDVRIVSFPVDCRTDTNGANDVPGQKDLTQECEAPTSTNPLVISWNWDVITQPGGNSADACALFDTDNDGLANYALCASWQNDRVMQAGYPVLYSCTDTRSDRCTGSTPLTITHGSTCTLELSPDDPFSTGDSYPNDTKAFCSINLADVGGASISSLIDVCSYPSAVPNSDPSDCVLITSSKGNLEVIKNVVPDDPSTNWNISWTGPTPYSGTITGDGTTGIQAVDTGNYNITEAAGTNTDLSLYDSTWACTVDGAPSTSGSGTTITGRAVAKGNVVICTFTNTRKTGSLEIKKDVVPDNSSTNWNFAVTGPDPTFTTCSIAGDGTCGAKTVFTGSYSITETAGSGTNLGDYGTSYACTVNGNAGPSGSGTTISGLTINQTDTVVCTFTNSQSPGTLTVNKVVVPSTDTGLFNLLIDGVTKASNVGNGGTTGAVSVSAGSHTVSETAGTGTDLNNYVTTITGDCDSSGNVSVQPNQAKTCTITNTRKGTIIVEKQTNPDGAAGSFTFTGDAAGSISDNGQIVVSNLAPGTYTSTESTLAADFALDSISCDDGSSATPSTFDLGAKTATFKLDPGETVTCTFTNKKLNPDLAVTKTADTASVTAGDAVGFSISVTNNGAGTANNVTLSDTLPAIPGVTWSIDSQPSGNPCTLTGSSLSCSFGNLAPGATAGPVHITGTSTAASCGTWNNTATAQADNNSPVTGQASIFVDCATIKISKTAASGTVSAGDSISYTITVTNDNSGTAHNVTVSDTLPTNTGLGTWTLSGADAGACSITAGVLNCNFGDVAGHASKTVTLTTSTTAATCGTVSNTASVTTGNDGSDSSAATVTVQCPSLSVTKTPDAATVNAGDPVGFTITVHNAGPGVAKSVTLTDTLPAGLTWTSTPGSPTCTITGQNLSCSLGDLASGADASVHVAATSSPSTCGPLTNEATATPTNGTAATSDPATITVNCADVTVTKTGNGPISAGDTATFTINVNVTGSGSLSNVTLSDPLPAGVTWALDSAVTGCSITGSSPQTLSCSWATLAAPQTITIGVSGTTSQSNCAAPLSNTATVAAANETDTTNDTASDSITVQCATVQIEKTTSTSTVSAGDTISYTITVSNPGLGTARNVTVTDSLPSTAGLSWTISPAVSGCSITGTTLTCNFGDIASGGSKSVTLTSPTTADSCGTISNTASVTTTNDGSATTPATDITVQCPDLSVTKTADTNSVSAGDTIGFTITVSNAGPGEAKGVMITDSLPGGLAWAIDAANTTATGCSISSGALTCGPDTITSGNSVTVHVTAVSTAASCGTLTNTATATPTNGNAVTSSESTITVLCPDLTVTKTGNGPISAGDTATFTIEVKNTGLGEAKNVTLTDTLPGGLTWALDPADPACSISGTTTQTLSCSWPTLASNASVSVTVSAVTTKDNCGTLTNSALVAATNEANTSNNSSGDADLEVDCATVQIEKTTSTPTVSAGDTVSYTITVSNPGLGTAKDVVVTDALPGGLTWTISPAVSGCSISGGTLTCNFGSLASGGSKSVTVTATTTADNCGTLSNTASVTTSNDGAATTPATDITVQCPSLSVTKTADAATVSASDTIGFTIIVSNAGPGEAKGVAISDSLPGGLAWTVDAANTTATGCSVTGGTLTCGPDTIASGGSVTVHVTAASTPAVCGTLSNTATATPTNGNAATSQTSTITVNCPDLTITKTPDAGTVSAGDTIGFTITVANSGLGKAYGVSLSDTLPTNAGTNWTIDPANAACNIIAGALTCTIGTLDPSATFSVHISSPTSPATCGGTVDNTAAVTATNEAATDNNSATGSVTVNCPSLTVTKTADAASVNAGDTIGFTITVSNAGPGVAKNVTLTDTLPTGGGIDWSIDGGTGASFCSISAGTLTCIFGNMPAITTYTVHITSPTDASSCKTYENTATVTSSNQTEVSNGDSVTVNCASISITKTTTTPTVSAGQPISYTLTVTNNGAGMAHGVTITDILPNNAGLNWTVDPAVQGCSVANNVLTCTLGDLASQASQSITLTSPTTYDSCATLSNTASVTTSNDGTDNSDPVDITVQCPALTVTKTADAASVSAGDPIGFTITVTNTGDGVAKNVTLSDTLPSGTGISWSMDPNNSDCTLTGSSLSCSFGDLANGDTKSVHITSPTTSASCGATYDNTATASADNQPDVTSSQASIEVLCASIQIAKTADSDTVSAGDTIGFTITVTNTGAGTARDVTVIDTLPTNSGLSWSIDGGTGAAQCSITAGGLNCSFGTLASGASLTVHITSPTTAVTCGTVDNMASVTTSNDGSATTPAANIAVQCPSLSVTKTADAASVSAGDTVGFTITVSNTGPGEAKGVTLTDTLPGSLAWTVDAGNTTATGCSISSGTLTCGPQTLASGGSIQVHVTAVSAAASCGTLSNTATATPTNGDAATSQTATITVNCPDLTIEKKADTGPFSAGDTIGFTITVTNNGLGKAYGVSLSDTLPTSAGTNWTIDPANAACSITGGVLTCDIGTLDPSATFTVHVSSPTTPATCGGTVDNTATVTATNEPSGQTNNSSSSSITVNCATIEIVKSTTTATVSAGTPINFTITVTNSGAGTARNVTVTDSLPTTAGLNWTIDPSVSGCSITGTTLTCNFGDIASSGSASVTLTSPTTADSCGTINNTASVTTTNDGSDDSSASVTVNCPDLIVEKTGNGEINSNDTAIYTITITNNGAGDATGVSLSDALPAGVSWSVDDAACSIDTNNELTCDFGTLAAGDSITIHVSGTVPPSVCGSVSNTVVVAATNEAKTDNNSATGSVTVNCASIGITKTAFSPISAGDTLSYTITVSNTGAGTAYGVTVTDTLPTTPGLGPWTVTPGDPTCTITAGVLSCSVGDMPTGTSQTITLSSPTTYASCGTISNTADVTTTNDGSSQDSTDVTVQCPALTVTKTADATTVSAGDPIGFTITVTNTGDGIARNVSLSDTLPTGLGIAWSMDPDNPDCTLSGDSLSCDFGDLAKGDTKTVHVTSPTTGASCGATYDNTATASADNQPSVTSSQASVTVQCASIQITKTADPGPFSAGDTIGFTINVTNNGAGNAYGVTVTDTLPTNDGLDWQIEAQPSGDPCSISGGVLTCNFGTMAPSTTNSVHITSATTATTCGTVENAAHVTTTNDGSGQASDSLTVNCPDVAVSKSAANGTVSAGDPISFNITVTNTGVGTARNVTLTDTLPTTSGLNWTVAGADGADCSIAGGVVTCDFGDLASNTFKTITLTSPTTPASCSTITNTATVAAINEPTGQLNNSSSDSITVNCPDVTVTKTADSGSISAGDTISYSITVTNIGAGTARNVSLTDTLPDIAGLNWSVGGTDATSCSITGGVLTCDFGDLAPTDVKTITLTSPTTKDSCAAIDNTATVSSTNEPTGQPNNSSTASVDVLCASIQITKTADNGTVSAGDAVGFTITVTNTGLGNASGVTVADTLPTNAGLSWSIDGGTGAAQCSIATGVLTCNFGTMASGASLTVHITSPTTADSCGTVANTASVASSNDGSGEDSASVAVNCPSLEVTKTPDTQIVSAGDPVGFTITVSNAGPGVAKGVTLNDTLPSGLTWSVDTLNTTAANCSITAGVLTCGPEDLASGASVQVHVTATSDATSCGDLSNTATATPSNGAEATSPSASITVNCPNVTVSKTADSGTINAGDTAAFTIVVSNTGSGTAYNVTLTDTLPTGVTWSEDSADCSITAGVLSCSFGDVASGATRTIHVTGSTVAANCGTLTNVATVAATNEPATAQEDNTSTANITVKCATLIIYKTTIGGDATFNYTATGSDVPANFSLTTSGGTASQMFAHIAPGAKTVTESTPPAGWDFTSLSCDDPDHGTTLSGQTANIDLDGDETVTCTFTNTQRASLTIVKKIVNDNGGTAVVGNFGITTNAGALTFGPPVESPTNTFTYTSNTLTNLSLGSKSLHEGTLTGYAEGTWSCVGNAGAVNGNPQTGSVVLSAGENVTCTITNDDQQGTLIVQKVVINDNGGTKIATDFSFQVNGDSAVAFQQDTDTLHGKNTITVDAGTYSVTEPAVAGYATTYSNCSNVAVANGGTQICTITNNDIAPSLTLNKIVVNNNGGTAAESAWTLTANGGTAGTLSGPGAAGSADVVSSSTFKAGTYALSESAGPSGYSASNWSCVKNGGSPVTGSSITLGVGDSATCTITNDDIQPKLIVIKHVVGGPAVASSFTMTVTGNSPSPASFPGAESPGTTVNLNAGSYNVTETGPAGYGASFSTGCSGSIAVGETKTCTVTNTFMDYGQIAPTGTTCQQYVNGTAVDFDVYYASQGGVIQYSVKSNKISQTNPGVFFYYTGLSQTITGSGPRTVYINQSDNSSLVGAFSATKTDVKLWLVTGTSCAQIQLQSSQITLLSGGNAGDVKVTFTAAAPAGSYYVISVQYATNSVVNTNLGNARPTVKYTFTTDVGNNGSIEETDIKGITLAPK